MKKALILAVLIAAIATGPAWAIGAASSPEHTYNAGNLTGASFYWYNNVLTSGDLVRLKLVDSKLTADGAYISALAGTTEVWRLAEQGTMFTTGKNAASGSYDAWDYTGTLGIMNGSDTVQIIDINITGADHTGSSNVIDALNIALTTPDAQATETAVNISANWDTDINATTSLEIGVDGTNIVTVKDPAAAGSGQDLLAITATLAAANGSDTTSAINVALTNANHTGTSNVVNGLNIAAITGDADATETAVNVGSGWDTAFTSSQTFTSQTTENNGIDATFTTDSTFLTGTDITYSGGRGSAALKLTGTWSGTSGGYSNIYSNVTKSGATTAAVDGVIGVKGIVTNTGDMTDGYVYGGQFWAKHAHATNDMANAAALIGLEGMAYDATSGGTVGTLIGVNAGYHNEVDTAKPAGSVYRALQIVCDDAAGSDVADEATGICIWNMAGTQTDGIKFVKSDGGFTTDIKLQNAETISNATDGTVAISGMASINHKIANVTADEGDASTTLTVAAYPSGSVITSAAATAAIVLPTITGNSGVTYTFIMGGATSFTLTGATACVMVDGQTGVKTNIVWSTTPLYLSVTVVCNGTNWFVTSMTTAPDSSS